MIFFFYFLPLGTTGTTASGKYLQIDGKGASEKIVESSHIA